MVNTALEIKITKLLFVTCHQSDRARFKLESEDFVFCSLLECTGFDLPFDTKTVLLVLKANDL